ncbi:membrane protein required for beta-lactamase induction [Spongiibacter sp. IMCC21906]|uniref:regulatory signaling modulator protein AmpE n=1 Tax=Spongiibacter sp. IMCC21906 TaxID=1620392 RepID=UPI00062DD041|nr:regulatory signaling modulator protein AmpE [Spongiibacter sp. IMCC21906]AKH68916.1 membrane protein required for beta-lactamase induction [Spongiibacter sp. IMCC21906]
MEFLAILVAWAAVQFWGSGGKIQQDDWLSRLYQFFSWVPTPVLRLSITVLLPVLGVVLALGLFHGIAWGLLSFALSVAVLLYSLGRGDFQILLRLYLNSWQRGDLEGSYRHAQAFSCELGEMNADNALELHNNVRRAVFYQGFERWFAVVFWFVLAGPAVALAYRLLFVLLREPAVSQAERDAIARTLYILEWLPVRLLALAFSLVGNFDKGFGALKAEVFESQTSADFLDIVGSQALPASLPEGQLDGEQFVDAAAIQLESAQHILSRSLLCWVFFIAIIQLV